jgi:predicted transcriptional regulator
MEHILGNGQRTLIVKQNESILGLLTLHNAKTVPASSWLTTTVAQVMIPAVDMKWVRPDAELTEALSEMNRDGVSQLPVINDGQVLGVLGRDDVISFFSKASEISRH